MFANTLLAALVALPLLANSALAATCSRTYTVKEGDWCDTISATNNASTYQLSTVNPDIDNLCSNLEVGWTLCLGFEGTDCTSTYVVQPDDTVDAIAASHSFNATILFLNNPQIDDDGSNLYVGEVLAVCNAVTVPEATTGSTGQGIPSNASPASSTDVCE